MKEEEEPAKIRLGECRPQMEYIHLMKDRLYLQLLKRAVENNNNIINRNIMSVAK